MTASLGVGKDGADLEAAERHVLRLCAQLHARSLVSVRRHAEQLRDHSTAAPDEVIAVDTAVHLNSTFHREIVEVMKKLEKVLLDCLAPLAGVIGEQMENAAAFKPTELPSDRESQQYEAWVCHYIVNLPIVKEPPRLTEGKRVALLCVSHLRVYQTSLELNSHLTSKGALEFLAEEMEGKEGRLKLHNPNAATDIEDAIFRVAQGVVKKLGSTGEEESGLIRALKTRVEAQMKKAPDSRILVFAKYRVLVRALRDFFARHPPTAHLAPEMLTSVNTAKNDGGQTDTDQQEVLEKFRSGVCKMLLATTVAEEGLDIAKCNLVIKYNHVTNEIAMVQKRGRGRAAGSETVLIASREWIVNKEVINKAKEKLMNKVIDHLYALPEDVFKSKVDEAQASYLRQRELELESVRERRSAGSRLFQLRCKICSRKICQSSDLRKIDCHYVCADPGLWARVTIFPANVPISFYTLAVCGKTGKLYCAHCPSNEIGHVLYSNNTFFPSLKKDTMLIEEVGPDVSNGPKLKQKQVLIRKWKMVETFFIVEDIRAEDTRSMRESLKTANPAVEATMIAALRNLTVN